MKLTYEDKVQIYELRNQGESFKRLSNQFGVNVSGLKYMVKLIDHYGINIIKKGKNRYYSPKLKREMIDKVLLEGCSQQSVSLVHAAVRADHKRSLRAQRIEMPPAAAGHRAKNQGCLCSQSRISFAAS